MWKAFSRSVCEVVERRVGFTAFRSDVSNRNGPETAKQSKIQSHGQICNIIPQLKTFCPLKHLRASRFKQSSHEHTGERQHQNGNNARWSDPPFTVCLGAMGWSTAVVLGWYLSHPLSRRVFGDTHLKEVRLRSSPYLLSLEETVHAQSPIQPLGIRPLTFTSSGDEEASSTRSFRSSVTSSSSDGDDPFTHQRGPFTPEEALDEVSRVFEAASHAFSGDVENKLGMVCMSQGQHSEAMKHFRRASHHDHAVAAYNMGQCYELGLGTSRNLKKAAKWYKIGSDRGHPTAMYNLAVFLANGWGGLHEDQNRARELLILAANSGLEEAKDALKVINKNMYMSDSDNTANVYGRKQNSTEEFLELIGASSKRESGRSANHNVQPTQTYLSHLDWLDLSSSSMSYHASDDMFGSSEERHFYSGLCLESDWSLSSSNPGKVVKIKNDNGRTIYYVDDCSGSTSSGGESVDE